MKKIMLLSLLVLGCSKSSDSPPAEGIDMSGVWNFTGVQCFNAALTTQTSVATPAGGFSETVTVTKNRYTAIDVSGACTVEYIGDIIVSANGTLILTNRRIISATGGSCTTNLSVSGGGVTPTNVSSVNTEGQTLAAVTNAPYFYSASLKALGLPSTYSNGNAGDVCFIVYQKQ